MSFIIFRELPMETPKYSASIFVNLSRSVWIERKGDHIKCKPQPHLMPPFAAVFYSFCEDIRCLYEIKGSKWKLLKVLCALFCDFGYERNTYLGSFYSRLQLYYNFIFSDNTGILILSCQIRIQKTILFQLLN